MIALALFAFVAGAGTAVSPCVLPVLPALLSAGATGGRRRPVGIALGLAITFSVTIVALSRIVDSVGLGDGTVRDISIAALAVFGVAVAVPRLGDRLEAPLSRLARFGPRSGGDGFVSGLAVGAALGFVYAPCAGPILAAVIAVSAATGDTILIGAAYSLGSAVVLLALSLGGRALLGRVRSGVRGARLQQVLGAVMVFTAVAMTFSLDQSFQTAIARHWPNWLVDPTQSIENSHGVQHRLADLSGHHLKFDSRSALASTAKAPPASAQLTQAPVRRSSLPNLGTAPDFTGTQDWFNTPGGKPLSLAGLRGRVVLVDFWTYTCINCIRTLPYLEAWDHRYRDGGLTIVGVHSPEFGFEKQAANVRAAIARDHIGYPVAQDNDLATWKAWGNQYWPADYLIDASGHVRYTAFGEGDYAKTEQAIRDLLAERGDAVGARASVRGAITPSQLASPETYLGTERAQGWTSPPRTGTHRYATPASLRLNQFAFGGTWRIGGQTATAVRDATITAAVQAKNVYLVLSSRGGAARRVGVKLDGHAQRPVTVTGQRLYQLVKLPADERHKLALSIPAGVSGYAFTFG